MPAWVKNGWVDFVAVSEFLFERGDLPIDKWKQAITTVPVYGGIECTKGGGAKNLTDDEYRHAATQLIKAGADGVYLFNFFTSREGGESAYEPPFKVLGDLAAATPSSGSNQWQPHEVRQLTGKANVVRLPTKIQIVTESWKRVVAVPYIVYMSEKDRLLMLVGCDYPHHPEVLFSDDRGETWSAPQPAISGQDGKPLLALGTGLCYLGNGHVMFYAGSRRFSRDYGETWRESVALDPTPDGKRWAIWDPPLVERDAKNGNLVRLIETGYQQSGHKNSQAFLRSSADGGATWSPAARITQWKGANEVALLRAKNGHLVAACRTIIPVRLQSETIDHFEGLGISTSTDDGRSWSDVRKLYDWGRHHPSLVLLPGGDIVMTYVVRKGYIDSPDGFPQFGIEAVVSGDHGQTWDLDHRYLLHSWVGNRKGSNKNLPGPQAWWASSQATSTVLLPDGNLLTAFGTGYRSLPNSQNQSSPRDVGLVQWRLNENPVGNDRQIRDAAAASDLRNRLDPNTGAPILPEKAKP